MASLVTAGAPEVPKALLGQLKDNGKLIAPIGGSERQKLVEVVREGEKFNERVLADCVFVPLVGKYGWPEED